MAMEKVNPMMSPRSVREAASTTPKLSRDSSLSCRSPRRTKPPIHAEADSNGRESAKIRIGESVSVLMAPRGCIELDRACSLPKQPSENVITIGSKPMAEDKARGTSMRIASVGHAVFAATMVALGILGLTRGSFAPIWDAVPKDLPAREALAYLCALVSLMCGIGLFWQRTAAAAARALFVYLSLWLLAFKVRFIVTGPLVEGSYQSCGETAVLVAGAWVLYAWFAAEGDGRRVGFAVGA